MTAALPPYATASDGGLLLELYVQPGARHTTVAGLFDQRLKIKLTAPPVDNKANRELRRFLAKTCFLPRSRVRLLAGERNRRKRVLLRDVAPAAAPEYIARFDTR